MNRETERLRSLDEDSDRLQSLLRRAASALDSNDEYLSMKAEELFGPSPGLPGLLRDIAASGCIADHGTCSAWSEETAESKVTSQKTMLAKAAPYAVAASALLALTFSLVAIGMGLRNNATRDRIGEPDLLVHKSGSAGRIAPESHRAAVDALARIERESLVIGVGETSSSHYQRLSSPPRDAGAMAGFLGERLGSKTVLLRDKEADISSVRYALGRLRRSTGDQQIVFVSAHGVRKPGLGGLRVVLYDTDPVRFVSTSLSLLEILDALGASDAKQKLLILDLCFSGLSEEERAAAARAKVVVVASTENDRPVDVWAGQAGLSLFTRHWLSALLAPESEGVVVSLAEVFDQVARSTEKGPPAAQTPKLFGRALARSFPITTPYLGSIGEGRKKKREPVGSALEIKLAPNVGSPQVALDGIELGRLTRQKTVIKNVPEGEHTISVTYASGSRWSASFNVRADPAWKNVVVVPPPPVRVLPVVESFDWTPELRPERTAIAIDPSAMDRERGAVTELRFLGGDFGGVSWLNEAGMNVAAALGKSSTRHSIRLELWARSIGSELVIAEVRVGGESSDHATSSLRFPVTREIQITSEWKNYVLDLSGEDLSQVLGIGILFQRAENPKGARLLLDEVRFVAEQ